MIDIDKAVQAAEALGWHIVWTYEDRRIAFMCGGNGEEVKLRSNGLLMIDGEQPITEIAPLIAAWAALVERWRVTVSNPNVDLLSEVSAHQALVEVMMTDVEIVARALFADDEWTQSWDDAPNDLRSDYLRNGEVAVGALREAGRLIPDGFVAVERGRWERVRRLAAWGQVLSGEQDNHTTLGLRNAIDEIGIVHSDTEPTS